MAAGGYGAGFHGKLPSRGDFVTFGLTGEFLTFWDEWLSAGLVATRATIGVGWETVLDSAPPWRFVLPGGLASARPIIGVMVPSRDRVARRFPLALACEITFNAPAAALPLGCRAWFDAAEWAATRLVAMAAEPVFGRKVANALGRPLPPAPTERVVAIDIVQALAGAVSPDDSLWWTRGRGLVAPTLAAALGMPKPQRLVAFMDGDWEEHGWRDHGDPPDLSALMAHTGNASPLPPSAEPVSGMGRVA